MLTGFAYSVPSRAGACHGESIKVQAAVGDEAPADEASAEAASALGRTAVAVAFAAAEALVDSPEALALACDLHGARGAGRAFLRRRSIFLAACNAENRAP